MPSFSLESFPLFIAPLSLLAGALAVGLTASAGREGSGKLLQRSSALGALTIAALPIAANAPAVVRGGTVIGPTARLVRVGSLDMALGFALDPVSLAAAIVVLAVLLCASIGLIERAAARASDVAVTLVVGAAALTAAMSEGYPTLFFGIGIAALVGHVFGAGSRWSLAGTGAFVVLASVGAGLLFWSLGGRWLDDTRYLSDFKPRFETTQLDEADKGSGNLLTAPLARGSLTVVSHSGARVYLGVADETQLARSEPFALTPFVRKELPAGLHKIVVVPGGAAIVGGDGLEAALVDTVSIKGDRETVITLAGPTLTFHEIALQRAGREDFGSRRLGSMRVATASIVAWGLALLAFVLGSRHALRGVQAAPSADAPRRRLLTHVVTAVSVVGFAIVVARVGGLGPTKSWVAALAALLIAGVTVAFVFGVRGRPASASMPAAALIAIAAFAHTPLAGLVLAAGLAPGLVALGLLAPPAPSVEKRGKKKKKKKKSSVDDAPPSDSKGLEGASSQRFVLSALAGAPFPCGAFFGAAMVVAAPLFSGAAGVVTSLAAVVAWGCLGWCVGRAVETSWVVSKPAKVAAIAGAVLGPTCAVALLAGAADAKRTIVTAVLLGLVPFGLALLAIERARSAARTSAPEARPEDDPTDDADEPETVGAKAARVLGSVDAAVSLPLSWIDLVFRRREAVAKDEPDA